MYKQVRGRGGRGGNRSHGQKQQQKRTRENSSEYEDEDPEVIVDTLVGALNDPSIMKKFVECLCGQETLVRSLMTCLLPGFHRELKSVLDPLKTSIDSLTTQLKKSEERCVELELKNDDLEQYTRRQSLRISGIKENPGENTDTLIVEFVNEVMGIKLDAEEIDRSHRVGNPKSKYKPTRDVIVRFVSWKSRQKILKARKSMHQYNKKNRTSYLVFEDLTKVRSALAYQARKLKKDRIIQDTWTSDGKIFIKYPDGEIKMCTRAKDLPIPTPVPNTQARSYASVTQELGLSANGNTSEM